MSLSAAAEPRSPNAFTLHPTASHVCSHPIHLNAKVFRQGKGVRPQLWIHYPQGRIHHAACKRRAVCIQAAFGLAFIQGDVMTRLFQDIGRGQACHATANNGDIQRGCVHGDNINRCSGVVNMLFVSHSAYRPHGGCWLSAMLKAVGENKKTKNNTRSKHEKNTFGGVADGIGYGHCGRGWAIFPNLFFG